MKKIIFLFPVVFFVTLLSISCANEENDSFGSFFLIKQRKIVKVHLIQDQEPPFYKIDFPPYSINADRGILNGIINFKIENRLKVILGNVICLSGIPFGCYGTGLKGICKIPFIMGDFDLLKFDESGSVTFRYKNHVYSLSAGEERASVKTYFDTITHEGIVYTSGITGSGKIITFGLI